MNKRRLLKLADLLETDAENDKGVKFDLGVWASPSRNDNVRQWDKKARSVEANCGTIACAVGLACISGAFARSGLTYGFKKSFGDGWNLVPKFDGLSEFPAVEKFFGLTEETSRFLFSGQEYPSSKLTGAEGERYVAKRIRDFVAGKAVA